MKRAFSLIICLIVVIGVLPIVSAIIYDHRNNSPDSTKQYTPEDEGDHFPTGVEWWWLYTTFTLENGDEWDMCIQYLYQMEWDDSEWSDSDGLSYVRIQSWDRQTGKHYAHCVRGGACCCKYYP